MTCAMYLTMDGFTTSDAKLSDIESGAVDVVAICDSGRRVALSLRRVGNIVKRGKLSNFLCEATGGRPGVHKYGYYSCSMIGSRLAASHVAKPYDESYHPRQTVGEYESSLHFDSIVRLWHFDDTPGSKK